MVQRDMESSPTADAVDPVEPPSPGNEGESEPDGLHTIDAPETDTTAEHDAAEDAASLPATPCAAADVQVDEHPVFLQWVRTLEAALAAQAAELKRALAEELQWHRDGIADARAALTIHAHTARDRISALDATVPNHQARLADLLEELHRAFHRDLMGRYDRALAHLDSNHASRAANRAVQELEQLPGRWGARLVLQFERVGTGPERLGQRLRVVGEHRSVKLPLKGSLRATLAGTSMHDMVEAATTVARVEARFRQLLHDLARGVESLLWGAWEAVSNTGSGEDAKAIAEDPIGYLERGFAALEAPLDDVLVPIQRAYEALEEAQLLVHGELDGAPAALAACSNARARSRLAGRQGLGLLAAPLGWPSALTQRHTDRAVLRAASHSRIAGAVHAVRRRLERQRDALEDALSLDAELHRDVLAEASAGLAPHVDELMRLFDAVSATGEQAFPELMTRLKFVREAIADEFHDTTCKQLDWYYDDDPVLQSLEDIVRTLETLPERLGHRMRLPPESGLPAAGALAPYPVLAQAVHSASVAPLVEAAGELVRRRRALYERVDKVTIAALESFDRAIDTMEPVHDADGHLRPRTPELVPLARQQVLEALAEKNKELAPLIADEHILAEKLRLCVADCMDAFDDLVRQFAVAAAPRGKWSLRGRRLTVTSREWVQRFTSSLRQGGGDRMVLRVRTADATREMARTIRRTINRQLKQLDEALDEDREFHDALMAPLEVALAAASRDLAAAFDALEDNGNHQRRSEALGTTTTQQLRRIRDKLQQVKKTAEDQVAQDPVLQALSDTVEMVRTLPDRVDDVVVAEVARSPGMLVRRGVIGPKRSVRIPIQHLLRRWIAEHDALGVAALAEELGAARGELVAGLTDIWNIVRYNLDGAVAEAADLPERADREAEQEAWAKSRDVALTGLVRAVRKTRELVAEIHEVHLRIRHATERKLALTNDVTDAAAAAGTLRGRLSHGADLLRFGAARRRDGIGSGVGNLFRGAYRIAGSTGQTLAKSRDSLKKRLGLEAEAGEQDALETHGLLADHLVQRPDLPPVYRRLFKLNPLELDEFLVGRDAALAAVAKAAQRWRAGDFASVLVHGDPGSGRRSLLNIAIHRIGSQERVVHCVLEHKITDEAGFIGWLSGCLDLDTVPGDLEELAESLLGGERLILRLEGAHHLFVRSIHGFAALESLLLVISRTNRHLLWLVEMERHTVELLQRLFRLRDGFTHIAPCRPLLAEELRAAIAVRHTLSGFKLRYEKPAVMTPDLARALKRARGDAKAQQEALATHFYAVIRKLSDGRPYAGIVHWLRSLSRDDADEHTLVVRVPEPLQVPALAQIPHNQQFALAALLQHGSLNAVELGQVLDLETGKVRLIVQYFHDKRIIVAVRSDAGSDVAHEDLRRYAVNPLLMPRVVEPLQKRNIVYWETS